MKKIFSLILVSCMLLSSLTAFAEGEAKVFEALTKSVYSGEFEVSVNAKLNKPLLIADIIENIMFANGEADPVDLKLLLESLINSEIKAEGAYNVSKDYTKADIYLGITASNPVEINESLKVAAWSKWDMWMQYDFGQDVPVYKMILKTPMSKKYIVMDMASQLEEFSAEFMNNLFVEEDMQDIQEKVIALYMDNSKINKKSDWYKITIDDKGFKNIYIGVFDVISGLLEEQYSYMGMSESEISDADEMLNQFKEGFRTVTENFSILGDKGFSIDMKVNSSGYITKSSSLLNIGINVFDILKAFGVEEEYSEAGITKENSDIDFNFEIDESLYNQNKNVKISYPVLTEENSYFPMDEIMPEEDYYTGFKYFSITQKGVPVIEEKETYVKLRAVAEELGFDISYNDGTVYVGTKTADGVVGFKTNSYELEKGGESFALSNMIIEKGGTTFVTSEALSYMGARITHIDYDALNDETYIYIHYEDPDYIEPEYEEEEYEEYEEEGLSQFFWVENYEYPIIKDDVIYVPLYPLLGEFNVATEEINADGNKISVSSDNSYVFRTLKIYENSLAVEKDGVEILIDNPVFKDGDCYWVGTDFTEKVLNSKLTDMSMSDYMTTYSFERE